MSVYCIFSTFYLPHLGGVERYVANLAHALVDLGQDVIIVTSALDNNPGITEEDGLTVVRIPSHLLLNKRFAAPRKGSELDSLMSWLRQQPIDYVLVNQRFYPTSIFGLKFAEEHRLPAIILDHGSAHLTMANPLLDFVIQQYEHTITTIGKRHCNLYFGVSENSVDWLRHFNINGTGVLHNAIDADDFKALSSRRNFRVEFTIPHKSFVVVFIGRLLPEKGVLRLCKAFQCIEEKGVDAHLIVAGAGSAEREVAALVSDHIHFVGQLCSEDVSALLSDADVFCFPTEYPEGFPTSMLEAAAHNLGIIVTDTGGARELIPNDEYGQVIPDSSIETVEKALLRFYDDREYLALCGANVGRRVRELFTWKQTAKALIDAFDSFSN